ncbi:heme-binding protein [uncultured Maribacter sp.]
MTFPGGISIKDAKGTIIGAIVVSGSSVENDHIVAVAGTEEE